MRWSERLRQRGVIRDKESTVAEEKPSVFERRFWQFAAGVVLLSLVTRVFDFSLVPPVYNRVQITRPFCGLHSWDLAARAWAARSHVKYGLGYTKGFRTLVVGDPPLTHPQYDVSHPPLRDGQGHRRVVRNGRLPARQIQTGLGLVEVQQPRVNDRRINEKGERMRFSSAILPPYLRRTKSLEELIPWLYLRGISTGDFTEALQALLGPQAKGLSATNIVRLKESWQQEWKGWSKQSLAEKVYVYLWADGIYFHIRLEEPDNHRQCILVLMGATADGRKELIAITDGYRESADSWRQLLLEVQQRGLTTSPKVATGDGALGFWVALREICPQTQEQRCWVHKTANVPDKMPKSLHEKAKAMLQDIWMADGIREIAA